MPLILSQKLYKGTYDDLVGEQYHYPRRYWSQVQPGAAFIYYHPAEPQDQEQYYFGAGRISTVRLDSMRPDHRYAEVIDYVPFDKRVPFRLNNAYLEARPGVGTNFFSAVRVISDAIFTRIFNQAKVDPEVSTDFQSTASATSLDQLLAMLNQRYKDLEPRSYQRLVALIDRPTSISRALKEKLGYTCQICGMEGFEKKAGGRYIEGAPSSAPPSVDPR